MQNHINQLIQQAFTYIQNRNFEASEKLLKNVIQLKPNDFNANNLLGVIYTEQGKPDECIWHLKKALKLEPNNVSTNYNMANALMLKYQHSQALPFHIKAVQLNPDDYWINTNYGISLSKLNQIEKAEAFFQKAVTINSQLPSGWLNLANCNKELERYSNALSFYDQALSLDPQYIEAWFNKGVTLFELKRYDDALIAYQQTIALQPDHNKAWSNAGSVLNMLKRYEEALACYVKAAELLPQAPEGFVNKGNALRCLKRYDEALENYNRALELIPKSAECMVNKGLVLADLKRYDEAIIAYQNAFTVQPNIDYLLGYLIHTKMLVNDWRQLDEKFNALLNKLNLRKKVIDPFPILSISDSPATHLEGAKIWIHDKYSENLSLPPIPKVLHKKIRIGYFSADFNEHHPVALLTAELFELHDRDRFEVYAFSLQATQSDDAMRKRLTQSFDHFIEVENQSDLEIATLARKLEIDIAVDLGGHTKNARTGILSYRAAPIQVNYLGYPGTMGATYIDYIVADKTLITTEDQKFYVEKVAYLPNSYMVADSKRVATPMMPIREEYGLPEDRFIFSCFNNSYKFNKRILESWSRILVATNNSILWVSENNPTAIKNLLREFEKLQIEQNRIIFAKRLDSHKDHLARYQLADLFLDTHPYNAHTTAIDALKSGIPVLTQFGGSFSGRVASSLLNTLGMPELITHSAEEYESLAIELASNPNKLQEIKVKLGVNKLNTPLFNAPLFTRHLESLYIQMYARYQADMTPECIDAK